MKKATAVVLTGLLALALAACSGGGDDTSVPPPPQPIASSSEVQVSSLPEESTVETTTGTDKGSTAPVVGLWRVSSAIVDGQELSLAQLEELGGGNARSYVFEVSGDGTCNLTYEDTEGLQYGGDGTWTEDGEDEEGEPLYSADIAGTIFQFSYNGADNNLRLVTPNGSLVMRQ